MVPGVERAIINQTALVDKNQDESNPGGWCGSFTSPPFRFTHRVKMFKPSWVLLVGVAEMECMIMAWRPFSRDGETLHY